MFLRNVGYIHHSTWCYSHCYKNMKFWLFPLVFRDQSWNCPQNRLRPLYDPFLCINFMGWLVQISFVPVLSTTVRLAVAGRCRDEEDADGGMRQTSVQQHGPSNRPTPPAGSAPPAAEVRYPFGVQNDFGQVILSGGAKVSPVARPPSGRLVYLPHKISFTWEHRRL
jgi:hypothetical protein